MSKKLLIPCLYLQAGRAVTGFGQRNLFGDGDVEKLARFYSDNGADELLVFDFSSGDEEHEHAIARIKEICAASEVPVMAAGNINRAEETDLCRMCKSCSEFCQRQQCGTSRRSVQTFWKGEDAGLHFFFGGI